ncbi:antitoxin [Streptomyces sp. RY43-2]|uniref:Antitoxin n=2 Tax=Streptomyces macrolidinus TaxID=2952607 RepID=A0ABT0ZFC9_9ACTN|nr:antitoxin [Streptomyces macrolidinus]MCN9242276.1 antitoxin [Streptomyces macrolidinus]
MSVMDKLRHLLKGHEEQESRGIDKGGDYIDDRTQGRYSDQIDQGEQTAQDRMRSQQDDTPPQ